MRFTRNSKQGLYKPRARVWQVGGSRPAGAGLCDSKVAEPERPKGFGGGLAPNKKGVYPSAEAKKAPANADAFEAEAEGFEPPERCRSTVFKTAAIDHSATPPVFSLQDGDSSLRSE